MIDQCKYSMQGHALVGSSLLGVHTTLLGLTRYALSNLAHGRQHISNCRAASISKQSEANDRLTFEILLCICVYMDICMFALCASVRCSCAISLAYDCAPYRTNTTVLAVSGYFALYQQGIQHLQRTMHVALKTILTTGWWGRACHVQIGLIEE